MNTNRIRFIGSGDAFGSGGRLQSCFQISLDEKNILLECGSTSMVGLNRCGCNCNSIGVIITSNLHGDHFGGIPYILVYSHLNSKRTEQLVIAGPEGLNAKLKEVMEAAFSGSSSIKFRFNLKLIEMSPGETYIVNGITIRTCPAVHLENDPHLVLRIGSGGKAIAYTGDTEWADEFLPLVKDADILISESYYFNKKVRFHLDYKTLESRLPVLNAGKVVIAHMSDEMLSHTGDIKCDYAEDGKVFTI
jgi:ribonuclease BN (tRNA processing enzyme)